MVGKRSDDDLLWHGVLPVVSERRDEKGRIKGLGTVFVCGRDGRTSFLLTCWHVVETIGAADLRVMGHKARVVASGDKALDLALLAVEDLPDTRVLPLLPAGGHPDRPFRTIGHFWADEKEDVPDSRPLDGRLGEVRRKVSDRKGAVYGWEFGVVKDDKFDRIRAGYSGAPVFDRGRGAVTAVISHQEGDDAGHAVDVSNLAKIYQAADSLFHRGASDEGQGRDPWIVKTLDHLRQVPRLRQCLGAGRPPVVALVDGCTSDLPKYLADDILLEPWPELDEIPAEATTLDPVRYGDDDAALWSALHATLPRPQQAPDPGKERDAVCGWLRERQRHVFTVTASMAGDRRKLPRLLRAAQIFLRDLAAREPQLRLLLLVVCQPRGECPPWWWVWWRRLRLERIPGIARLEPLGLLERTDINRWYDGFSAGARRTFNRDQLLSALLDLCDEHPDGVRYRLVRRRLLDGGALDSARIEP